MENSLYIYHMVVPLRYYTYDLHSEKKDSEYVMGLKQDILWIHAASNAYSYLIQKNPIETMQDNF